MELLILDLLPAYIPFMVQCTKAAGDKINPTVDNLIIYEEGGADATFDSGTITGSPFDPVQVNSKTGLWGMLVAKSAFTAGKFYIALWEMTVDGVTTAKIERYFACNASQFKADVSTISSNVTTIKAKTDNLPDGVKKNTALSNFTFLMVDTDGNPKTGLTVAAQRSIDGAAFSACANSVSELADGIYKINLDATDLNGDVITLKFVASGAKTRFVMLVTQT